MRIHKSKRPRAVGKDSRYKITNWSEYNQALKDRGSLEIWIDSKVEERWYYQGKSQRGGQYRYSEECIELAATLRELYNLPYRQTQGFLASLIRLAGWNLQVPDYTSINRRRKNLRFRITGEEQTSKKKYILIDSTGLKVYGEGEWKVRQHGWSKRRTWKKIHLTTDEATGQIESCAMSGNGTDDAQMAGRLFRDIEGKIAAVAGDGAYDKKMVYEELARSKIKPIIPPRKGAKIWKHGNTKGERLARDENVRGVRQIGLAEWKRKTNYHRRSKIESTMFRIKTIFSDQLTSRNILQQNVEVNLKCKILNRMTKLGMPISYKISNVA